MSDSIGSTAKKSAKGKEYVSDDLPEGSDCVAPGSEDSPNKKGGKTSCNDLEGDAAGKQTGVEGQLNIVSPPGVGVGKEGSLTTRSAAKKRRQRHYVINAQNGESRSFGTIKEAKSAYLGALLIGKDMERYLSTRTFDNDESLKAYIVEAKAELPSVSASLPSPAGRVLEREFAKTIQDDAPPPSFQAASNLPRASPKNNFAAVVPHAVARTAASSNSNSKLAARRAKLRAGTSRLEVNYWKFTGAHKVVYSFDLMEKSRTYWTHKTENWGKILAEEMLDPVFVSGPNLCVAMNYVVESKVRKMAYGPNEQSVTVISPRYSSRNTVLRGFAPIDATEDDIKKLLADFVTATEIPEVRDMYYDLIHSNMVSEAIAKDCNQDGKYWKKLTGGLLNITVQRMLHLNQVFMDHDIELIIGELFAVTDQSSSTWAPEIRVHGFGPS